MSLLDKILGGMSYSDEDDYDDDGYYDDVLPLIDDAIFKIPKDIIFTHLEHNNSGSNYVPSRMYKDVKEIKQDVLYKKSNLLYGK